MAVPGPRNLITDVAGLLVGQADDRAAVSGTTVVLCQAPAMAAVDIRGGAPGSRETALLETAALVQRVDAIVLSGGSAFGLDAAAGVMAGLAARGRGFAVRDVRVPIVPAAILFDLTFPGRQAWTGEPPYRALGRAALDRAGLEFALGNAGAGLGAKAGRLKGGLGSASLRLDTGHTVGALVAVNSWGSAVQPVSGRFWAADQAFPGEIAPQPPLSAASYDPDDRSGCAAPQPGANTTIAVVATDAALDRGGCQRLAIMAQDGLAQAIRPAHTPFDGDTVFALATGDGPIAAPELQARLGAAAASCLARAIMRALTEAASLGGYPGWRERYGVPPRDAAGFAIRREPPHSWHMTEELPRDRLETWLLDHVEGFRGPLAVERFAGGQSNPTYRVTAGSGRYVLRKKPSGPLLPSAHAVDREYRVMQTLAATAVPVPRVYALCEDEAVIGRAFYVMEYLDGRIYWDQRLPEIASAADRAAMFDSMNAVIAALHQVDYGAVGLAGFGRPGNYMGRQIGRWSSQYRASETETIAAMDRLIEWLPLHLPAENPPAIVHGDYRMDNLVFHKTEPRVIGVLDWELSTIGDPLADFAYHVMTWRVTPELFRGVKGVDFATLGIPDEPAYVAAYCRRTGRASIAAWDFYMVYSLFRIAAIVQGIAKRAIDGTAASEEAVAVGRTARPLAEQAWELAQSLGR